MAYCPMGDTGFNGEFLAFDSSADDAARPKYEQLRDHFANEIRAGRMAAGSALPSEHRLAESLQIARSTVRQAMAALEREGLVRRVHGKGTFVHEQARARARGDRDLFALIVPETQSGFYPSLQRSFEESAAARHSQVIVCNSNNEMDRQGNTILQLIDHRVAGVAIVPSTNPATPAFHIRQLQQHGIPVVCCSRRVEGVAVPLLGIPSEMVGRRAGQAIIAAGHRHIAYIATARTASSEGYERGFRGALREASIPETLITTDYGSTQVPDIATHEQEVSESLDTLLKSGQPPTAIFASFDSLAELIHMLLIRRGIRVPEDISLVGFGGIRRGGAWLRRLTSVTLDEVRLGQEAVALLERMRHGELPIAAELTHDMPVGLSDGMTLARPNEVDENSQARRSPAWV